MKRALTGIASGGILAVTIGWRRRTRSPIAATALREPMPRRAIHPKTAARFPAAFRAMLRFLTRTVRKPPEVVASDTIEASRTTNELRRHLPPNRNAPDMAHRHILAHQVSGTMIQFTV